MTPPAFSRLVATLLRNRWLVRAPISLYRMRVGFLLGSRLMMLEHRGRRSGQRRYVVLEVIDRPDTDTYVIASGFATASQWYLNLLADPRVRISVGLRHNVAAVARLLSPDEAEDTLDRYAERHPQAWARLRPVLESTLPSHDFRPPMFAVRPHDA